MRPQALLLLAWPGILFLAACGLVMNPGMIGEEAFEAKAVRMDVTGRGGWFRNKVVRFGTYHTDEFDLGWIRSNSRSRSPGWKAFASGKTKETRIDAKTSFSFTQYDSSGQALKVDCEAVRKTFVTRYGSDITGERTLQDRFEIRLSRADWARTVVFPMGFLPGPAAEVEVNGDTLRMVNEAKRDMPAKRVFEGVRFMRGGETVGAVNRYYKGSVWLRNDLPGDQALVVAALSTALLLKPDLEPHVD